MNTHYSFKDILEDEYYFHSELNLKENKTEKENIELLINEGLTAGNKNLKMTMNYLNKKIINYKNEESENIPVNYFRKIVNLTKDYSRDKNTFTQKEKLIYLTLINSLCNYFIYFNNQTLYLNSKHKGILTEYADFFKLFMKLCETNDNIDIHVLNCEIEFFIIIINYFPHLARSIEAKIMKYLNSQSAFIITNYNGNIREFKRLAKNFCLCFTMTNFTQSDFNQRFNSFFNKLTETLNFLNHILEPVRINSQVQESQQKFDDKNLLFEKKVLLEISGVYQAKNAYYLLFKMYKFLISNLPQNILLEINFQSHLTLLCKIFITLVSYFNFSKDNESNDVVLEGLSFKEMNMIKTYLLNKSLRLLRLFLELYGHLLMNYIPQIKKNINNAILNKEVIQKYIESHVAFLDLLNILISKFGSKLYTVIEEAIFSFVLPNTFDIYTSFIERKDKTVIKTEKKYTKITKKKEKEVINMIDLARNDVYNVKLEKYSIEDLSILIEKYINIFQCYFNSNNLLFVNSEKIAKIENLIGNILYPPHAKFIYNLDKHFKANVLNLLYSFVARISKSKITVLPQTFNKILEFSEKNYRFEKEGELLNIINKIYLVLNNYIPSINYSSQNVSYSELENIYTSLLKFKQSFWSKYEDCYRIQDQIGSEQVLNTQDNFIPKQVEVFKNEESLSTNQVNSNKNQEKEIVIPERNEIKQSSKVTKIDQNNFKTKDGIHFTSFKDKEFKEKPEERIHLDERKFEMKKEAETKKETIEKIDIQMKEVSSDEESISIPDIN